MTADPARLALAALALLLYGLACLLPAWLQTRRRRVGAAGADAAGAWLVLHASQSGAALELAERTVATLRQAGAGARLLSLGQLGAARLREGGRMLFVVSTCGEGDAPDEAAAFVAGVMGAPSGAALGALQYAVLALGDCGYRNYCGFGRALDGWLAGGGARALAARIEVDRGDGAALQRWQRQLADWCGLEDEAGWQAPPLAPWRLAARVHLNPGSAGAPVFHLELEASAGLQPDWQAGDLAQVAPPDDLDHPREYSIASLPADGRVHLLVRQHVRADGTAGAASGWLTGGASPGATVAMRVRAHPRFRLEANAQRPLILIGNGTGLGGLRAHLKARAPGARNWLVFGERNAAHDFFYHDEILQWQRDGVLARVDTAFSRDQARKYYVQDCLRAASAALREWVADGAAIYVCGSLAGMAGAVDDALRAALGDDALNQLAAQGRYRRDVY